MVLSEPHRYDQFHETDLILRDQLALDRTKLANDRTLLSFMRTSLAMMAAGGAVLHFFIGMLWITLGWTLVLSGPCIFAFGVYRYRTMNTLILTESHTH
jgi:putative membrane protein